MFIFEKHDLQKGGYVCFCKKCGLIKRVGFKPSAHYENKLLLQNYSSFAGLSKIMIPLPKYEN